VHDRVRYLLSFLRRAAWVLVLAGGVAIIVALIRAGETRTDEDRGRAEAGFEPAARPPLISGPRERPAPAIVWAVGDGDVGRASARVVELVLGGAPDRFLYLGDVYGPYRVFYEPTWGLLKEITAPTPGEEEWGVPETPRRERARGVPSPRGAPNAYAAYWSSVRGAKQPPYYAFRLRGWEILSLNSPLLRTGDESQLVWLRRQLREPGSCRIAFWHHPWRSAAPSGGSERAAAFWRLLRGRAVLVLNADSHSMQHFRPRFGITQLVAGSGGHGLHPLRLHVPGLLWADGRSLGALRIVLSRRRADFSFVTVENSIVHSGFTKCSRLRR
jgi:hypothetical protein